MNTITSFLDTIMCVFWILTYTLVLIGTILYKFPLISPITQAIIAPFEFSVCIYFLFAGAKLNYAVIAYLYWAFIEITIIAVIIRQGYIKHKQRLLYIVSIIILTCFIFIAIAYMNQMFFLSYFNTFIGVLVWFAYIFKAEYPFRPIALFAFVSKFCADLVAIFVYLGKGNYIINSICILLSVLDLLFIIVYVCRALPRLREKPKR